MAGTRYDELIIIAGSDEFDVMLIERMENATVDEALERGELMGGQSKEYLQIGVLRVLEERTYSG